MKEKITRIAADHKVLSYTGRIGFSNPYGAFFIYPASSVSFRFKGSAVRIRLMNHRQYWESYIGYSIDGVHNKKHLPVSGEVLCLELARDLKDEVHEITIYKRMDGCHAFCLMDIEVNGDLIEEVYGDKAIGIMPESQDNHSRKMVFYGDSITAGEVSEASDYIGQADPEHQGQWSNCLYSYAHLTATQLSSSYDLIAQGGIALLDGTGWYDGPNYMGMESVYDKVNYQPSYGPITYHNMNLEEADVVVVAIGQNDQHPWDYMQSFPQGDRCVDWQNHYKAFLQTLRYYYPNAYIVCMTTLLEHDEGWDKAIEGVVSSMEDDRIRHYLFERNGIGTKGHLRLEEAQEMARECANYIATLEEVFEPKGLSLQMKTEMVKRSVLRDGSVMKIAQVMNRIRRRGKGTIAFIGGSITQGAGASSEERCYAARVFATMKRRFPEAELRYVNAGVGGTTSHFGVARVEADVLTYKPDLVFVEFSVNDMSSPLYEETYEGLVRRILLSDSEPAVVLIHNMFYDSGNSAQDIHGPIGDYYNLPAVSLYEAIYPAVKDGLLKPETLATDYLHPTDEGHRLIAACVEHLLIRLEEKSQGLTKNRFEKSYRVQGDRGHNKVDIRLHGFEEDRFPQRSPRDCFKKGWLGRNVGDGIELDVTMAKSIAVQYKKMMHRPAPICHAIVDGDEAHPIVLDANFEETWGDCLYMETLIDQEQARDHHIWIRLVGQDAVETPFHLVSIIVA